MYGYLHELLELCIFTNIEHMTEFYMSIFMYDLTNHMNEAFYFTGQGQSITKMLQIIKIPKTKIST